MSHPPIGTILGVSAPRPGQSITFDLLAGRDAFCAYQVATALQTGSIACGLHTMPLSLDPVFWLSVSGRLPQVFEGYAGHLDAQGRGRAVLHLPSLRALVGVRVHTAFVTLDQGVAPRLRSMSPAFTFTVTV